MTGPEHYQHAEELLDLASDDEVGDPVEAYRLAAAQVHATLALAAATALNSGGGDGLPADDYDAWYTAAAVNGAEKLKAVQG